MKMIKSWKVTIVVYRPQRPKELAINVLDAKGPDEYTVRRKVLQAAHKRGQFIREFGAIEEVKT